MNLLTMKLLFDLFPVILFFAAFKIAEGQPDAAIALAERFMGEGLTAMTAPGFIATVVSIASPFLPVGWPIPRGRKVEPMLLISLAVIVVFGSLTLYLRNEMFIKWKPTILYWIFGGILVYGNFAGRNFIRMLLSKAEIEMPGHAWGTLQNMWIGFFAAMGVVNLLVAYLCSTDTWVNFKLFGLMGLTLVFTIGIGVFMTKHAVTRQN